MALPETYLVVCEGASEVNYLAQLNRILATLPISACCTNLEDYLHYLSTTKSDKEAVFLREMWL